jgi:hypothetical protein
MSNKVVLVVSFIPAFEPKPCMQSSSPFFKWHPCPSHSLDFIILIISGKSTSNEAPHYAVFSSLLLVHHHKQTEDLQYAFIRIFDSHWGPGAATFA